MYCCFCSFVLFFWFKPHCYFLFSLAANVVIQRPGCTYPPVPSFVYADDKKKKKKDKDGKKKDKKVNVSMVCS